jgi:uncharacterized protein (DUF2336 family)
VNDAHPIRELSRPSDGLDEDARVRLGASAATPPALLQNLVHDSSVTVRVALALNPAAPPQANTALAHDDDERVRIVLARKLAVLAPSLSPEDQENLRQQTWDTLVGLVADEAVRVRAAIADTVKEMPDAPRELILQLAQDTAVSVSEPVVRLSPLLTSEDLVALLAAAPTLMTALTVARRPGLDTVATDAIAEMTDTTAISAMLANPSAQIREATLDALIARSTAHIEWHEPLVRRPSLPPRAAFALSQIVSTQLLQVLATRADLAPALAEQLRKRLATKLAPVPAMAANQNEQTAEQALAQAISLAELGDLTEQVLLGAARRGESRYATALLAVAAQMPVAAVDRAATLHSAKALVSLVWKAGFTMRVAGPIQGLLARLAPDAVLTPGPGGSFPLEAQEMRWQLEFLARVGP